MAGSGRRGRFVTLEGGEGAGKSTQVALLRERLLVCGVEVVATREPGGTPLAEKIRWLLKDFKDDPPNAKAELLLFLAARAQLVESVIAPALADGKWVVSDRFSDSTIAYQCYGRGLDMSAAKCANAFACGGLEPDITFFLDLDPAKSVARRLGRETATGEKADRFECAGDGFHKALLRGFREMASANPVRIKTIDASRSREEVSEAIWRHLEPLI